MAIFHGKTWAEQWQEKIIQLLGSAEALERDLAQVLPVKEAERGGKVWVVFQGFSGNFQGFSGEL